MKKTYVVCERCHKAVLEDEVIIVVGGRARKSKYRYYCNDCIEKIKKWGEAHRQWKNRK